MSKLLTPCLVSRKRSRKYVYLQQLWWRKVRDYSKNPRLQTRPSLRNSCCNKSTATGFLQEFCELGQKANARYFTGVWGNTFEDRRFLTSPGLATGRSPAQVQHRELSRAGSSCWRQSPFFRTRQPTAWRQEQTPPEWGTGYFKRFILSPTCASFGTSTEARQSLCRACTAGLINTRGHRNSFSQLRMFSGDEITHKMSIF